MTPMDCDKASSAAQSRLDFSEAQSTNKRAGEEDAQSPKKPRVLVGKASKASDGPWF